VPNYNIDRGGISDKSRKNVLYGNATPGSVGCRDPMHIRRFGRDGITIRLGDQISCFENTSLVISDQPCDLHNSVHRTA